MNAKYNDFIKLWGMPIWMAVVSLAGLTLAILGTGIWHTLSWIALSIPVYVMVKHGRKFFRRKAQHQIR